MQHGMALALVRKIVGFTRLPNMGALAECGFQRSIWVDPGLANAALVLSCALHVRLDLTGVFFRFRIFAVYSVRRARARLSQRKAQYVPLFVGQ
jgi:hypothetical protein